MVIKQQAILNIATSVIGLARVPAGVRQRGFGRDPHPGALGRNIGAANPHLIASRSCEHQGVLRCGLHGRQLQTRRLAGGVGSRPRKGVAPERVGAQRGQRRADLPAGTRHGLVRRPGHRRGRHAARAHRATVLNTIHCHLVVIRFGGKGRARQCGRRRKGNRAQLSVAVCAGIGGAGIIVVGRACAVPRCLAGAGRRNWRRRQRAGRVWRRRWRRGRGRFTKRGRSRRAAQHRHTRHG